MALRRLGRHPGPSTDRREGGPGATHVALPAEADFDDRDVAARFPERGRRSPLAAIAFDVEHIYVRPGEGEYGRCPGPARRRAADAVIVDPLSWPEHYWPSCPRVPVVVEDHPQQATDRATPVQHEVA
ncbi:MAG TPA: hypothetical protein VIT65_05550 [Microlunatus sp.]